MVRRDDPQPLEHRAGLERLVGGTGIRDRRRVGGFFDRFGDLGLDRLTLHEVRGDPTFGRVSRHGAMALSWSMDKLGPMCRSVEDCALVFGAIQGADGLDPSAVERPFVWDAEFDVRQLRVGFLASAFERELEFDDETSDAERIREREWMAADLQTLEVLRAMGVELVPIELPDLPVDALSFILSAEAGAAFDELTRSGADDLLVRQIEDAWPNVFRQARTIPAVEYIQANRVRTLVMREMERILEGVDCWMAPSFGGANLLLTNLTGHPAVVVPNGFASDGTPTSVTFNGSSASRRSWPWRALTRRPRDSKICTPRRFGKTFEGSTLQRSNVM